MIAMSLRYFSFFNFLSLVGGNTFEAIKGAANTPCNPKIEKKLHMAIK